eukprot:COSAG01_NODE_42908_length_435_cov_0.916667_2_plen_73_part_01
MYRSSDEAAVKDGTVKDCALFAFYIMRNMLASLGEAGDHRGLGVSAQCNEGIVWSLRAHPADDTATEPVCSHR